MSSKIDCRLGQRQKGRDVKEEKTGRRIKMRIKRKGARKTMEK